jgi:catechol 2,3-dioxygenase-like lactoylglutathione lyase family enzyme
VAVAISISGLRESWSGESERRSSRDHHQISHRRFPLALSLVETTAHGPGCAVHSGAMKLSIPPCNEVSRFGDDCPRNTRPFVLLDSKERRAMMIGKADATPMLAVKDLDRARKFYEDTLGLKTKDEWGGEGVTLKSGDTLINVYRSEFAGTNKATALTFEVDDIDNEVRDLKDKGILFEHYDVQGLQREGDVYRGENMKTAWFKDPDGNILSLIEE